MTNHKNHGKQLWVSPDGNGWKNHIAGQNGSIGRFENKVDAVKHGTTISKGLGLELVIQKKTGEIQDRRSHGHDPYPPRG